MIIAGYGGLGIEIYGLMINDKLDEPFLFYDENPNKSIKNKQEVCVTSSLKKVKCFFTKNSNYFIVGIGHPRLRRKLTKTLEKIGGVPFNYIAPTASILPNNANYLGLVAQPGSGISHSTEIGKSCSLHINSIIGHDVKIGSYVTIGPNSSIIGPTEVGDYCLIGSNSIILPNIKIGKNVIVGAGSVVDRNLKDNEIFIGKRIK
ncbi:MAG TPA: acetyltransferase [Flavobacteriales bacterium]|nr:acetyltransferase [Flavobacteriales bacterium]